MSEPMRIVPFICSECSSEFHELDGGICIRCHRLLCSRHLVIRGAEALCRQCLKERPPEPLPSHEA
jgi:hypothetical protein